MSEIVLGDFPIDSVGFTVAENWVGRVVVVAVSGDLDMGTAPALAEAIVVATQKSPTGLVVDLSRATFLSSAGINLLTALHHDVTFSVPFGVVADGPVTGRPLELVGIDQIIVLYPTLVAALADFADA
jgi:anti-sigma B factor antagonist